MAGCGFAGCVECGGESGVARQTKAFALAAARELAADACAMMASGRENFFTVENAAGDERLLHLQDLLDYMYQGSAYALAHKANIAACPHYDGNELSHYWAEAECLLRTGVDVSL